MEKVAMQIHVPRWVKEERREVDIARFLLFEASGKMEYYRSRIFAFERKYGIPFEVFEERIKKAKKENFEQWDDLIIWEGFYQAYGEWKQRYKELKVSRGLPDGKNRF